MRSLARTVALLAVLVGLAGIVLALSGVLDGWLSTWECTSGRPQSPRECWYGEAKLAMVELSGGLLLAGGIVRALTGPERQGPGLTLDLSRLRRRR